MTLQTNADTLVTIFGGSGFLGRHVVRALAKRRYRIRVAVRRPELANFLQPLGSVGQIHAVQANVRYPRSIEAAVRGSSVVINLVGILYERGAQRFDVVHAGGAERTSLAAAAFGARMIHVSAIGADENSTSAYARTKAEGEQPCVRGGAGRGGVPSVGAVRPGGRFLQPLRRDGAFHAGAAACRRRTDEIPAGFCRRRRRSDRARRRRQDARRARPTNSAVRKCAASSN